MNTTTQDLRAVPDRHHVVHVRCRRRGDPSSHRDTWTSQPERPCAAGSTLETNPQLPNCTSKVTPNFQACSEFAAVLARPNSCPSVPNKNSELEMRRRGRDQALTGEGYVEASLLHGVVGLELQPGYMTAAGQRGGDLVSREGPQHRRFGSSTILHSQEIKLRLHVKIIESQVNSALRFRYN